MIKSASGKILMTGLCLGAAGNIFLPKPNFAYADYFDKNLEMKL
jgi:hypothetical protein